MKLQPASKLYLVIILCFTFSANAQHSSNSTSVYRNNTETDLSKMQKDILFYVNKHRKSIGLNELQMINEASSEALGHSTDMSTGKTLVGHDGFDERIENIVKKIGFCMASGENVAMGILTAEEVVNMWLNSPGHKRNIEGDFTITGIGIAKAANGYLYYTQIFLRK